MELVGNSTMRYTLPKQGVALSVKGPLVRVNVWQWIITTRLAKFADYFADRATKTLLDEAAMILHSSNGPQSI